MAHPGLPDPDSSFGRRVRRRLHADQVIWITTVGQDGTPQPNPVGFLFADDGSILTYNAARANRLTHIVARPRVSLHLDGDGSGGDIVVFAGLAQRADDLPAAHENPGWLAKYGEGMAQLRGSIEKFSAAFPVPVRIEIVRTRGF